MVDRMGSYSPRLIEHLLLANVQLDSNRNQNQALESAPFHEETKQPFGEKLPTLGPFHSGSGFASLPAGPQLMLPQR